MKSTREGFGDQIVISADTNKDILVMCADLEKCTKVDQFAKLYPDRFFEVGIAENNMIGIASGLSEYGYKVFIASFASFLTGKYDTIRCSIAYPKAPVVLVGSHVGMAIGRDGVTQMGTEDVSLMRALPGMIILNPATYIEAKKITEWLCNTKLENPYYLRIGRQPVKEIFDDQYEFRFGKLRTIKHGGDALIFVTGCILPSVIEAAEHLDVTIVNVPTLKPLDTELIDMSVSSHEHIFTVEDHSIIGGLGSAIAEVMSMRPRRCELTRIGLNDTFAESGEPSDLYEKYGLSVGKIRSKITEVLNDK